MKNWYCKPASEAEAVEIVERAVANGAVAKEVAYNMSMGAYEYPWHSFNYWGVFHGKTMTHDVVDDMDEQLTIQQVREQFPLPHEAKVMSDKKEWKGQQDGLPPAIKHALLIIVADLYENRQSKFTGVSVSTLDTVQELLHFKRVGLGI